MAQENQYVAIEMEPVRSPSLLDDIRNSLNQSRDELGARQYPSSLEVDKARFISEGDKALQLLSLISKDHFASHFSGYWADVQYFSLTVVQTAREIPRISVTNFSANRLDELMHTLGSMVDHIRHLNSNHYIICAPPQTPATRDTSLLEAYKRTSAVVSASKLYTTQEVSNSMLVAFLLLVKHRFSMSVDDVILLFDVLLPQANHRERTNKPSKHIFDEWQSVDPSLSGGFAGESTSTKAIDFPGQFPSFSNSKFFWMEVQKLHGQYPRSVLRTAIWGRAFSGTTSWSSIIAFSDNRVSSVFAERLDRLLSLPAREVDASPASHWVHSLRYLYQLALNDAHIRLAEVTDKLETLKYSNLAEPTVQGSLVCLMFMNHLQYHQSMVERLHASWACLPSDWAFKQPLPWTRKIQNLSGSLLKEIKKTHAQASSTRILIIEQQNLSQSRSLAVLTILATIFVPMSAVAGFFGMNTTEINGSNWSTKSFGIVAAPLTIVSVLLPLFMVQILGFLVLLSSQHRILQLTRDIIFLLSLVSHIMLLSNSPTGDGFEICTILIGLILALLLTTRATFLCFRDVRKWFISMHENQTRGSSYLLIKRLTGKYAGSILFGVCYTIGSFKISYVSFAALCIYFVGRGYSWYRHFHPKKRKAQ